MSMLDLDDREASKLNSKVFLPCGGARAEGGISFSIREAKSNCLNWKFLNFENGLSEKDSFNLPWSR